MIKSTVLAVAAGAVLFAASGSLVPGKSGDAAVSAAAPPQGNVVAIQAADLISPHGFPVGGARSDSLAGLRSAAADLGAAAGASAATMRY